MNPIFSTFSYLIISLCVLPTACSPTLAEYSDKSRINYLITGISGHLHQQVNVVLKESTRLYQSIPVTELMMERWDQNNQKEIHKILQAYGYFKGTIQAHIQKHSYRAVYHISPGPILPIKQLIIQLEGPGKENRLLATTIKKLSLQQGKPMTSDIYQTIKRQLYKTASLNGYLEATWKIRQVNIDLETYTAHIELTLNTGLQYKIGPVRFSKTPLQEKFLREYLPFKEGDAYCMDVILDAQTNLQNSGYFRAVNIQTPIQHSTLLIPVDVDLKVIPKYYTLLGIGWDNQQGLRVKTEGLVKRLNDRGHQISVIGQHSKGKKLDLLAIYTIPGTPPTHQKHQIQLEWRPPTNTLMNPITGLSYIFTHKWHHWSLTAFTKAHWEKFQLIEATTSSRYYQNLIPSLLIKTYKHAAVETPYSYQLLAQVQGSLYPFASFLKLEAQGEYSQLLSPWLPSSYLVIHSRLGKAFLKNDTALPPSLQFYAGGSCFPRGYAEYLLGSTCLGFNLELRKYLSSLFYLTPFVEICAHYSEQGKLQHKNNIGIGLYLWYSRIGYIEISLVGKHQNQLTLSGRQWGMIIRFNTKWSNKD
jgi:translocation and assembly module TamA